MMFHVAVTATRVDPVVVEMVIEAETPSLAEAAALMHARTLNSEHPMRFLLVTQAKSPTYQVHEAKVSPTLGT